MQNALTTIADVLKWLDDNECYIWVLHGPEKKYIISRQENTTDPTASKKILKETLESRANFGGVFELYINDKKGNGGHWSPVVLPPLFGTSTNNNGWHYPNQVAGIGNMGGGGVSIGDVEKLVSKELDRERELWSYQKRIEELENATETKTNFWERQWEQIASHPNFNPNTVPLAIGGLASKVINILEIAMGVNGSTVSNPIPQQQQQAQTPVNGGNVPPNTEGGGAGQDAEMETFDEDILVEVCEDLSKIYTDVEPEKVLKILKNKIKTDPNMAAMVRQFAGF